MIQCKDCELSGITDDGKVLLKCNPYRNIKESGCLAKWQLLDLESMFVTFSANSDAALQAYKESLREHRKYLQSCRKQVQLEVQRLTDEVEDKAEGDKWKHGVEDEET